MRIFLIAPPWMAVPPVAYGGTERIVDVLARGLVAEGHDVQLHATGDSTCPVRLSCTFPQALGTDHIDVDDERAHVTDALRRATAWGADLIHDHTETGPLVARRLGVTIPTVWTNHGPFTGPALEVVGGDTRCFSAVAISCHQASTAPPGSVTRVIHHGLEWDDFPVGDGRGGYALFLGRMCPEKGAHRAVQAARRAGVPLVLAAKMREPAEHRYFEQRVKPWLGAGVEYVGEAGFQEKLELLGGASCLLNPISWPEPFGLVMIESLACGTPVVTTPSGSAPEIIEHGVTGHLARDAEGMVEGLLSASSLDRAACRAAAESRFSARRMVADHLDAYRMALADVERPDPLATDPSMGLAG